MSPDSKEICERLRDISLTMELVDAPSWANSCREAAVLIESQQARIAELEGALSDANEKISKAIEIADRTLTSLKVSPND